MANRDSTRRAIELLISDAWELNSADRYSQALVEAERALKAARELRDAGLIVRALVQQASANRLLDDSAAAMVAYVEIFKLAKDPENESALQNSAAALAVGSAYLGFILVVRLRATSSKEQLFALLEKADTWFVSTGHAHWRAGLMLQRAEVHLDSHEYDKALEDAQVAYETYDASGPGFSRAYFHNCLRRALLAVKQGDKAAEHFRAVLEAPNRSPHDSMLSNFYLSDYHEQAKRTEYAVSHLDEAVLLSEECDGRRAKALALSRRGKLLRTYKRYPEALADLDRAVEYAPTYMWAVGQRGIANRLAGNFEQALADFDSAIRLNPAISWAYAERGEVHRQQKRYQQALADLDRAIERKPDDAWCFGRRGAAHRMLKHHREALADFDRALALNGEGSWTLAERGLSHRGLGHYEQSIADLTRSHELKPQDWWILSMRGDAYRAAEHYEEALRDFDAAIQLDGVDGSTYLRRGTIHRIQKRYEQAEADFDQAIARDPELDWAWAQRGWIRKQNERFEPAEQDLAQALRLKDDYPWARAQHAETLRRLGRFAEAVAEFDRVIAADPKDAWSVERRKLAAEALKRAEKSGQPGS